MRTWRFGALVGAVALMVAACGVPFDYDNDGKADIVWMLENGDWIRNGDAAAIFSPGVGAPPRFGDAPNLAVPGDYDGNRVWEPAVVINGTWITGGARGTFSFPAPPNTAEVPAGSTPPPQLIPVPGDYDGDGKTDAAWYRESDATWWIEGQPGPITFGIPWTNTPGRTGYDVPVPADFDGDGKADIAVYNPDHATFAIRGVAGLIHVGFPDGFPAAADYNGDGRADPAVLNQIGSNPGDPPGSPSFQIAGQPSDPLPAGVDDSAPLLPIPANYDGVAGAEPAADMYVNGTQNLWVSGSGTTQLPAAASPIAPPLDVLTAVRIEFGLRCTYHPFPGTTCVTT